jgi:hypothetical protein
MTLLVAERRGIQTPRVLLRPQGIVRSSGPDAVELAAACGLVLDVWQSDWLFDGMAERSDGSWAASDVGLICSRQNGKNAAIEALEMYRAVVLGETIIHTSHLFKTTRESFKRLLGWIEANPDVRDCLTATKASAQSGFEMEFRSSGRVIFIARSRSSGRGLTGDLLIFDEAQDLSNDAQGALLPTISARPFAQSWYLGSAPNLSSEVFHRYRRRGRAGLEGRLAWREHSANPDCDPDDREHAWSQGNPARNVRIFDETIESERHAMTTEMFLQERLSVSPDIDEAGSVIGSTAWAVVCSPDVKPEGRAVFAIECNPERSWSAVAVADSDGRAELIDYEPGTNWLVARASQLSQKWGAAVAVNQSGPAGAFIPDLKTAGVKVVEVGSADLTKACGAVYDAVMAQQIKVRTDIRLDRAVVAAQTRPSGDAWIWDRKSPLVDISPWMALTIAYFAAKTAPNVTLMSAWA